MAPRSGCCSGFATRRIASRSRFIVNLAPGATCGRQLDDVPGIGVRRRKMLLTAFGSLAGVRRATREELSAVVGLKAADAVIAYFTANP